MGIQKTKDTQEIKKAYRELIKRFHPDTVRFRSPEKIRRYTVKTVEIMGAYKEALEYAKSSKPKTGSEVIRREKGTTKETTSDKEFSRAKWAAKYFFYVVILLSFMVSPFIFIFYFPRWFTSLPIGSLTRMIISALIAIPLGALIAMVLGLFTSPLLLISACLDNTKFATYMWKILWVGVLIANILIVYCTDFHWPFEHRFNGYYNFLYHICRITAWAFTPCSLLIFWLKEQRDYWRVKGYKILSLSEIESIQ